MKKNDWSILISVLLYSILFYEQSAGLNFFLFNLILTGLLLYRDHNLIRNKIWLSVSLGALISSFFIFVYGSALAIWADLISLLILGALSIDPRTSFITSIFITGSSVCTSFVFMFIDWVKRKKQIVTNEYRRPFYVKLFLIIIPLLITLIFFFFYQSSNPLFYNFTRDINLDFISIGWIFFTYSGLLLLYGFFHVLRIKDLSETDINAARILTPEIASRKNFLNTLMRVDTEMISGLILFSMLNALLLVLNVLDLHYLWFDGTLPAGMKHKEFVHDGVGALISSVIAAIIILLFYFRGELNFYKQNKWLRSMAYIWIIQNLFMIFSTAYRNHMYISESGLSYKKIGVYVYLLLVFIGLVTTFIKVNKLKTNWFLFRVNAAVFYYVLVFSGIFNWDIMITNFNIKKHNEEKKELEKYLILDLSFKNLPQLYQLPDSVVNSDDLKARDYYYALRGVYYNDFRSGRDKKLYEFLKEYKELEWPSSCLEKTRVYNDMLNMREQIKELRFKNGSIQTLKPLTDLDYLTSLQISNDHFNKLSELKGFPLLVKLSLRDNELDTISEFPELINLKELDLSGNNICDLSPLRRLRILEILNVAERCHIQNYNSLLSLKKLRNLTVGDISGDELSDLQKLLPGVTINTTAIQIKYRSDENNQ